MLHTDETHISDGGRPGPPPRRTKRGLRLLCARPHERWGVHKHVSSGAGQAAPLTSDRCVARRWSTSFRRHWSPPEVLSGNHGRRPALEAVLHVTPEGEATPEVGACCSNQALALPPIFSPPGGTISLLDSVRRPPAAAERPCWAGRCRMPARAWAWLLASLATSGWETWLWVVASLAMPGWAIWPWVVALLAIPR